KLWLPVLGAAAAGLLTSAMPAVWASSSSPAGSSTGNSSAAAGQGEMTVTPNSISVRNGFAATITGRKITIQPGTCWIDDHLVKSNQAPLVELAPCPPK